MRVFLYKFVGKDNIRVFPVMAWDVLDADTEADKMAKGLERKMGGRFLAEGPIYREEN